MSESSVPSLPPSRLSRLLGWTPAAVLLAGSSLTWIVFLSGSGMRSVFAWLALMQLLPLVGLMGCLASLAVLAVRRWRGRRSGGSAPGLTRPLGATLLASLVALATLPWNLGVGTMAFPYRLSTATPAATVRLPLTAPVRVLWGGDALARNQHAMLPDQRWAYDLGVEPVMVGSKRLEDYGCWGAEVVAPAAGRVHLVHDGAVDLEPGVPHGQLLSPLGNHVALALPSGTFLLLAHLQRGSVLVREGDEVREGQPLGRCGNSGNTSEPHVHIHHQRQDPRGRPINVSEGLPLFFRDHDGAPMPEGGLEERGGRVVATGALVQHRVAPGAP